MKRDWDVIRDILVKVEALSDEDRLVFTYGGDADADAVEKLRAHHAALLLESGYLTGSKFQYLDRTWPIVSMPNLTWAGHDLLDTIRSKAVWERIKTTAKDKGLELTFDSVKALGKVAIDWVIAN